MSQRTKNLIAAGATVPFLCVVGKLMLDMLSTERGRAAAAMALPAIGLLVLAVLAFAGFAYLGRPTE